MSTIKDSRAPWETYDVVGKDSPELAAEVEAYSKRRHDTSSSQNEELLAEWKEGNKEIVKEHRWLKPEEYENIAPRIGKIMGHDEFINILRNKLGLSCFYREMGDPQKIALWAVKGVDPEPQCVCWVKRGVTSEFSVMGFDDKDLPTVERYRGWRTCLMRLVQQGFVPEHKVRKVFGRATGPASEKYNKFMQDCRTVV